jgi:hypothetical protein
MTSATSPVRSIGESHLTAAPRALAKRRARGAQLRGWLFVIPALTAYAAFVLWPIFQTFRYSFYNWDGVSPAQWAGVHNYKTVFSNEQLVGVIGHAFELIVVLQWRPGRTRPCRRHRHASVRDGPVRRRGEDGAVPASGRPTSCCGDRLELDAVDKRRC